MPVSAQFKRYASYTVGMILLAIGLTLTAQTHLGTSPLTSVAYVLAEYTHNTFSNMTLLMFTLFVLAQIALAGKSTARKTVELLLQIPLSLVFTRVMGAVHRFVDLSGCTLPVRLLCLFLAILLTGVGAAMTLQARLIPNPGDGIVQALSIFLNKPIGQCKNVFDVINVIFAAVLSYGLLGRLVGVGIGSVLCMLGVGRVIALCNWYRRLGCPHCSIRR